MFFVNCFYKYMGWADRNVIAVSCSGQLCNADAR